MNKNQQNIFCWVKRVHPAIQHCPQKAKKRGDDNSIYHLNQIKQAPQQKETAPIEVIVVEPSNERHSDRKKRVDSHAMSTEGDEREGWLGPLGHDNLPDINYPPKEEQVNMDKQDKGNNKLQKEGRKTKREAMWNMKQQTAQDGQQDSSDASEAEMVTHIQGGASATKQLHQGVTIAHRRKTAAMSARVSELLSKIGVALKDLNEEVQPLATGTWTMDAGPEQGQGKKE